MEVISLIKKKYDSLEVRYIIANDPLDIKNEIMIAFSDRGVVAVRPVKGIIDDVLEKGWQRDDKNGQKIKTEIESYLRGELKEFSFDAIVCSTDFKVNAWKKISQIPYGNTISYSELAKELGNAKAFRAAASGCATNPVPLLIPCHRVLNKNGDLGGFGWGIDYKIALLDMEQQKHSSRAA